jgi:hypothetical protein
MRVTKCNIILNFVVEIDNLVFSDNKLVFFVPLKSQKFHYVIFLADYRVIIILKRCCIISLLVV